MRRAAKVDDNQKETVSSFRKFGCSVLHLHSIGQGCPDILVAKNYKSILIEIKDGNKPPSARELTPDEKIFHNEWKGLIMIVKDLHDVIEVVKVLER